MFAGSTCTMYPDRYLFCKLPFRYFGGHRFVSSKHTNRDCTLSNQGNGNINLLPLRPYDNNNLNHNNPNNRMGSGASQMTKEELDQELSKPVDASDCETLEQAQAEIKRIRDLLKKGLDVVEKTQAEEQAAVEAALAEAAAAEAAPAESEAAAAVEEGAAAPAEEAAAAPAEEAPATTA